MKKSDKIRTGCKDIWNAFMVSGAEFTKGNDIPICHCDKIVVPKSLISYEKAKNIYKGNIKVGRFDFVCNSCVHFYQDDYKFEGRNTGIWYYPYDALNVLKHFSSVITPDFSTYADFPDPLKRYNTYRMRAYGYWLSNNGISVIHNVRWGTEETWSYCFDGIPKNAVVSIGTVASGLKEIINRPFFEDGLYEMAKVLQPDTIIVYGSANYPFFESLIAEGTKIIAFPSETNDGHKGGKKK